MLSSSPSNWDKVVVVDKVVNTSSLPLQKETLGAAVQCVEDVVALKDLPVTPTVNECRSPLQRSNLLGFCETCFSNMSRPMVLVFLLVILIITSQFEWKQQLVNDQESQSITQKQQQTSPKEEVVKEKIILSQERKIQKLNELVRSLREQLLQCRGSNDTSYGTTNLLAGSEKELEQHQILED